MRRIRTFRRYFVSTANEIYALWLALRDPHASWAARLIALVFAFYVILPLDVIPEPVPLLGIVDDLLAFPVAYFVISRMLPQQLTEVALRHAQATGAGERLWRIFLVVLALLSILWIAAIIGLSITIWRALN